MSTPAIGAYVRWLKRKQPYFYKEVIKKYPQAEKLNGLGLVAPNDSGVSIDTDKKDAAVTSSWADTIKSIITSAGQIYLTKEQLEAQKKLTDIQLTRVQQGLAPLDLDPVSMGLPAPTVNFGVSGDTKKLLLWGGVGAAALLVLSQLFGRRRT